MPEKDNYKTETNSTIRRWQKYREDDEQNYEAARQGIYTFFEKALSNEKIRENLSQELKEIRRAGPRHSWKNESGYNMIKDDYDPVVDGGDFSQEE